jgi:hypothetical protein
MTLIIRLPPVLEHRCKFNHYRQQESSNFLFDTTNINIQFEDLQPKSLHITIMSGFAQNERGQGMSHASAPSKLPEGIQRQLPKSVEEALPESVCYPYQSIRHETNISDPPHGT